MEIEKLAQTYQDAHTWEKQLFPPFSEAEVLDIEMTGEFRFPDLFRWYLLNVSREVSCHYYRETVECREKLSSNQYLSGKRLAKGVVYDWESDEDSDGGDRDCLAGSIWIGNDGCSHQAGLIVKGLGFGTVVDCDACGVRMSSLFKLLSNPYPTARRAY